MKLIKNLGFQILVAMVIGTIVGVAMGERASMFAPLGDIFIKLIKMLVVPLVAISIVSGAASLGATKSAGKMGIGTFAWYMITTAFAVVLGLILGEIFKPGVGLDIEDVRYLFNNETTEKASRTGFWDTILGFIPENHIEALVSNNIIQIIFFCLLL